MTQSPEPTRPTQIGPYRILDLLGEGGMGSVYLAEQREPVRRRVALKVIKLGMDSKAVLARFEAERRALSMMEHSCIATVLDAGVTPQGQPFFVMEFVKGIPITDYCDQNRLGLLERIELMQRVCSGVQHAHLKGVMHRDLKPGNVLVTLQEGKPVPKIIDFGLAKATDHHLVEATLFTEQGVLLGTPEYMSPEQAGLGGLDVDTRTDVYSLGVLLYELLTGELPFSRKHLRDAGLLEMQRVIREQEPAKPSTKVSTLGMAASGHAASRRLDVGDLRKKLRGDLDWIVLKALEKDRTRRYETVQEMAADLERHLLFQPVLASPPSLAYRLRKYVRRYRLQVASTVLVLFAIVGGGISAWLGFTEAKRQAQIANDQATQLATHARLLELAQQEAVRQQRAAEGREAEATWRAYVATIRAADADLSANEWAAAQTRLAECPVALRGWEWHYLSARAHMSLFVLRDPESPFAYNAAAFSADGSRLHVAMNQELVTVDTRSFEIEERKRLEGTLLGIAGDGVVYATSEWRNGGCAIRLHDARGMREVGWWGGHENLGPRKVRFDALSRWAYFESWSLRAPYQEVPAILWDVHLGTKVAEFPSAHGCGFSDSSDRIAIATDNEVTVWSLPEVKLLHRLSASQGGASPRLRCAALSPDLQRVAAGGQHDLFVWQLPGVEPVMTLWANEPEGHGMVRWVHNVHFAVSGSVVAAAGDRLVKLWDARTGRPIQVLGEHSDLTDVLVSSPKSGLLASRAHDGTYRVWDARQRQLICADEVAALTVVSSDHVALATEDRIEVRDCLAGALTSVFARRRGHGLLLSPGRGLLVHLANFDGVQLLDANSGEVRREHDDATGVAIDAAAGRYLLIQKDTSLQLCDLDSGHVLSSLPANHPLNDPEHPEAYWSSYLANRGPDGGWIVAYGPWLQRFTADLARLEWETQIGSTAAMKVLDAETVVIGHDGGDVSVVSLATGQTIRTMPLHRGEVRCLEALPDGSRVFSAGEDATVRVWDPQRGEELLAIRTGAAVKSMAISPRGDLYASIEGRGALRFAMKTIDWPTRRAQYERLERAEQLTAKRPATMQGRAALRAELLADASLDPATLAFAVGILANDDQVDSRAQARRSAAILDRVENLVESEGTTVADLEQALLAVDAPELAKDPRARFLRGGLLVRSGRSEEAVSVLEALRADHHAGPRSLAFLAIAQAKLGRRQEAVEVVKAMEAILARRQPYHTDDPLFVEARAALR